MSNTVVSYHKYGYIGGLIIEIEFQQAGKEIGTYYNDSGRTGIYNASDDTLYDLLKDKNGLTSDIHSLLIDNKGNILPSVPTSYAFIESNTYQNDVDCHFNDDLERFQYEQLTQLENSLQ